MYIIKVWITKDALMVAKENHIHTKYVLIHVKHANFPCTSYK